MAHRLELGRDWVRAPDKEKGAMLQKLETLVRQGSVPDEAISLVKCSDKPTPKADEDVPPWPWAPPCEHSRSWVCPHRSRCFNGHAPPRKLP